MPSALLTNQTAGKASTPPRAVFSSSPRMRRNPSGRYRPMAKAVNPLVSARISEWFTTVGCTPAASEPVLRRT